MPTRRRDPLPVRGRGRPALAQAQTDYRNLDDGRPVHTEDAFVIDFRARPPRFGVAEVAIEPEYARIG